jgi:hypothetical protein
VVGGTRLAALNLEDRLHDYGHYGLEATEYELGHGDGVAGSPPKFESLGLTVRRVTCAEELTDSGVSAANWEPPDPAEFGFYQGAAPMLLQDQCPMKLFLGSRDDEPVASSELFLTGRVAGLYSVCTRTACRERGIGFRGDLEGVGRRL